MKIQTQSSADRLPTHSALPIRGKKYTAQTSPYTKLTQTTGPNLGGQKPKGRKNSTLKPGKRRPQTLKVKKNHDKAEKYYTNEGTN